MVWHPPEGCSRTHHRDDLCSRTECARADGAEPRSGRLLLAGVEPSSSSRTMEFTRLDKLAPRENCPRLHLLGAVDVLRSDADGGRVLAAFGIRALASAGVDRLHHRQSLPLRRFGTGPRIPHCEFYCTGGFAPDHFVRLSTGLAQALQPCCPVSSRCESGRARVAPFPYRIDSSTSEIQSGLFNTSRGLGPSAAPTMPSRSMRSIKWAALP